MFSPLGYAGDELEKELRTTLWREHDGRAKTALVEGATTDVEQTLLAEVSLSVSSSHSPDARYAAGSTSHKVSARESGIAIRRSG